ncbi:rubredoxin [Lacihabitans soyangensis]|uniref:Rubredoxin n=1 Tax=Lacihabitans soyangensis TaxID=869394 RepID=A0AAE3GYP4_9BACT|nr:rubredoxin [Lacihabitans soyangensis]MCP9761734.1 rubredoxin [Lacihabitans soyangensis]
MNDFYKIRINFKGGVVSPGELKQILVAAQGAHVKEVRLSLRQQLILHIAHPFARKFEKSLADLNIKFQVDSNEMPNLVSSYVAEDVFQKGNWITEGIYKDIFDTFDYDSKLKINISDNAQSFTPFFSGHLNFVSSSTPNFWYLFLRKPKTNHVNAYDKLIFSNEIAKVSKSIEEALEQFPENEAKDVFENIPKIISIAKEEELKLPKFTLPYYEGFNRYGKKTWLGIYRRNELFSVSFLLEMCDLCLFTKLGEICFTPWKSLIIKGIEEADRKFWSSILAKHNINVRHAANELNWQVEDDSEEALKLKNELVESFNRQDIRTFGICFGIKTVPKTEVFASIMVQRRRTKLFNVIPFFNVYDISYTEDFDPNGRTKVYLAKGIQKMNLSEQLRRSVLLYNKQLSENSIKVLGDQMKVSEPQKVKKIKIFQCNSCLSIYDSRYGDELAGVPAGITFENLPSDYRCGLCEEQKSNFKSIEMNDNFVHS